MFEKEAIPHVPEADSFDVKASLNNIKSSVIGHLWVVLVVFVLTVSAVTMYIVTWPPVFEASVVISADSEEDLTRNAFYQQWNIFRREATGDEAILMTSDPILRIVIEEMDLKYEDVYHPFMSHVVYLWGESWLGKNYRALKYKIFPPPPLPPGITEDMLEKFKVLKDFRESVILQPIGENNIALLIVRGPSPRVADIANKLIEVYLDERRKRYVNEAKTASIALQNETEKAYAKLVAVEQELQQFYADNSLYLTFEKDRVEMTQWLDLQAEIRDLQAHEAQLLRTLTALKKQLEEEGQTLIKGQIYQDDLLELRDKLTQLQISLRIARQTFQENSPEVLEYKRQIEAIEEILQEKGTQLQGQTNKTRNEFYETIRLKIGQIESDLAGVRAGMETKQATVKRLQPIMQELPSKMQKAYQLQREQMVLEGQYKALNEKLVQATVSMTTAQSAPSAIRIVDQAYAPDKPAWPNTKLMLLVAMFFGVVLGVICALGLDLIFVRVNRYKLYNHKQYQLFAVLENDEAFVDNVYQLKK